MVGRGGRLVSSLHIIARTLLYSDGVRSQCRIVSRDLTLSGFSFNRSVWLLWERRVKVATGDRSGGCRSNTEGENDGWGLNGSISEVRFWMYLTGEPVRFSDAFAANVRESACIGLLLRSVVSDSLQPYGL